MEEMTGPSGSTHSILRGYDPSNPHIVSFERCNYTHRSTSYTHCLREVVVTCLLVVSNRQVAKITVHADGRPALCCGNVVGDAEAEPVPGECEGAHRDSWLRNNPYCVLGQGYTETFPSYDRNLQSSILRLETITGDELRSDSIGLSSRHASSDRLLPRR